MIKKDENCFFFEKFIFLFIFGIAFIVFVICINFLFSSHYISSRAPPPLRSWLVLIICYISLSSPRLGRPTVKKSEAFALRSNPAFFHTPTMTESVSDASAPVHRWRSPPPTFHPHGNPLFFETIVFMRGKNRY